MLEARIRERFGVDVMGDVVSYEELPRDVVGRLLDELVTAGGDFPVVLVDGHVACSDGVDVEAVMRAFAATRQ